MMTVLLQGMESQFKVVGMSSICDQCAVLEAFFASRKSTEK